MKVKYQSMYRERPQEIHVRIETITWRKKNKWHEAKSARKALTFSHHDTKNGKICKKQDWDNIDCQC